MSLRMIKDVLAVRDIESHCPLCGRSFARFSSDEEHIYPKWLQHHHNLWTRRLNIPNFIGKQYKSVKIKVCRRCNGTTFGALESLIAPYLTDSDSYSAASVLEDDHLAVWLGKIFWLLVQKSRSAPDFRTRSAAEPDFIIPSDLMAGTLFLGMIERAFATRKGLFSCYSSDPPVPELYYEAPYSLYRFRIDMSDARFESFDFFDNPSTLGVGFRSGSLGVVCIFDGGLHKRFRRWWYEFLIDEALHPMQFAEVAGRMIYDQTVLDVDATQVTYYWNSKLNAVVAQTHTPRYFNPYLSENHDPERLASLLGRLMANDPAQLLRSDGSVLSCLHDKNGKFLKYAVTSAELAAARADPDRVIFGPSNINWRIRENGPE
jgi:hypothetical protein